MGLIWEETVDLAFFVQTVREDLPDTPNPILEAIASRVVREFCEKTFCLTQMVYGETELPTDLDLAEGLGEGVSIETVEGDPQILVHDEPPDRHPVDGRVTDIGEKTWRHITSSNQIEGEVSIGDGWNRIEADYVISESIPVGKYYSGTFGHDSDYEYGTYFTFQKRDGSFFVRVGTDDGPMVEETLTSAQWPGGEISVSLDKTTGRFIMAPLYDFDLSGQTVFHPDANLYSLVVGFTDSGLDSLNVLSRVTSTGASAPKQVITTTAGKSSLTVWFPKLGALTFPSSLVTWDEYIKAGILSELQAQPNKPWSSQEGTILNRHRFEIGIGKAKAEWYRLYGKVGAGRPVC